MTKTFDLDTKFRVLLTETLPYELPIIWDNSGYVRSLRTTDIALFIKDLFSTGNIYIPFQYKIRQKGGEKSRDLHIVHPVVQMKWCDLYNDYDEYMIYLCSRSPFSIRHIDAKNNYIIKLDDVEDDTSDLYEYNWNKLYKQYYTYKDFDVMYQFYESGDYIRLEQKYRYMLRTDVASCFYHIYTHSITWAIKDKEYAKNNIGESSFENTIDDLMQITNYKETNGIVVGPEFSRIFAEIILQQVDINLLNRLKEKYNYHNGKDYEIRRYVDDYFIYSNDEKKLQVIKTELAECLSFYKLDINVSKTQNLQRPFVATLSAAKAEAVELVDNYFRKYLEIDKSAILHVDQNLLFCHFVKRYDSLILQYGVPFSKMNAYVLSIFSRKISELDNELLTYEHKESVFAIIQICCYLFSLDISLSVTNKLCYIISKLVDKTQSKKDLQRELCIVIDRELQRSVDISFDTLNEGEFNIEMMNILILWNKLSEKNLSKDRIAMIFNKRLEVEVCEDDMKRLNFLQIEVLLYLMQKRDDCKPWKEWLIKEIMDIYKNPDWKKRADLSCLYLDLMVCPNIDKPEKKAIIRQANTNIKTNNAVDKHFKKFGNIDSFFMDWKREGNLERAFEKKQYHSRYN